MTLNANEIKKRLNEWHFCKAYFSASKDDGELEKQLSAIERAVAALDASDAALIRMRFFERVEAKYMAQKLYITRQAVYKRLNNIIERMAFCISNGGNG